MSGGSNSVGLVFIPVLGQELHLDKMQLSMTTDVPAVELSAGWRWRAFELTPQKAFKETTSKDALVEAYVKLLDAPHNVDLIKNYQAAYKVHFSKEVTNEVYYTSK